MGKRGPKPKDPTRVGNYNINSDGTKRDHTLNTGKRMDPRRVDRAEELFCGIGPEGVPMSSGQIARVLASEFGVSENHARTYIKVAKQRLAERNASFDPEAEIERSNIMFLDAFGVAKQKGDPHGMVAATHRRAELLGIFTRTSKVDVQVSGIGDMFGQIFSEVPIEALAVVEDSDAQSAESGYDCEET